MKRSRITSLFVFFALFLTNLCPARQSETNAPARLFADALVRVVRLVEPTNSESPRTLVTSLKVVKADGLPKELVGQSFDLAFQAPDHLRFSAQWQGQKFIVGRDQQEVWVHEPDKEFGLVGTPEVPLFSTAPERKDNTTLGPIKLPLPAEQILLLPFVTDVERLPDENVGGTECRVIKATTKPEAVSALKLPRATLQLWVRATDSLPMRIGWREEKGTDVQVELINPQLEKPWPADQWKIHPGGGDKIETVARAHLTRFLSVALGMLGDHIPTLGPETGEHHLVASEGKARLELVDGTRVLCLKGSPEEMGHQHGTLLKKEIHGLVDRILYGVGVGSSFEKGRWFFGEIEKAQARLNPFMDERYLREMDAMADAAGLQHEEVRLANFFLNCSTAVVSLSTARPQKAATYTMGEFSIICAGWGWNRTLSLWCFSLKREMLGSTSATPASSVRSPP